MALCPVLVERDRELAFLRRLAGAAADGPSQLVVLTGESGTGKSRLAQELVAGLGGGWTVRTLVVESGVAVPSRRRPAQARPGATGSAGASLAAELASGSPGPTVAVLEDGERLDPAGVAALGEVIERSLPGRLLLIAQVRTGVHAPGADFAGALAQLLRSPWAHEVPVAPLSTDGLRAMAGALGVDLDDEAAVRLRERTGGNAFFSEEVLLSGDGEVPWTVTDAVMQRLAALPTGARAAADLLAVAGAPVARSALDVLAADPSAASTLLDAGMVRRSGAGSVVLRHALVAEVIEARLSGDDRRRLNRELAEVLERDGWPPERLARLWWEAGEPARAAAHAADAADRAGRCGAHRTAAELYRLALVDPPAAPLARAELLQQAATAAGWAGMGQDALRWAQEADATYRAAGEPRRAVALWLEPGLEHLPKPELDHRLLADDDVERVLEEARDAIHRGRPGLGAELARRALAATAEGRGEVLVVRAARRLIGAGELVEGERHLQRERAAASAAGDRARLNQALGALTIAAMCRGDLDEALRLDRQAVATAEHGNETAVWTHQAGIAVILAYRGDLEESMALVGRLVETGSPIVRAFAQLPACIVEGERGELDRVAGRLEQLAPVAALRIDEYTAAVLLARALLGARLG